MRFRSNGPDIPEELVARQEKGETIFVCGAGVSRTIGLPLFRGLVEGIYNRLGERWDLHVAEREGMAPGGKLEGEYDRVLRCLERRLVGSNPRNPRMRERIRAAVREELAPPDGADLGNHLALLELSRDPEGRIRVLTTNFDTVFERAWHERNGTAIASHAGPAMPQPKVSGFMGVLHLHGRLPDQVLNLPETDLVLTSAEFGDAYLRTGWASRYVYDLVRAHTVVLVGYQADDPPMRYLLEALEADRERYPDLQAVYAFASCTAGDEEVTRELWRAKAVEPILYMTDGEDHSRLYGTLREWRVYADDPTAWRRERLRAIVAETAANLTEDHKRECATLLSHGDASQLLAELSPAASWLPVLGEMRIFGRNGASPGQWIATRLNDPEMIRRCASLGSFDEQARWHIAGALERERGTLSSVRRKAWRLLLAGKNPSVASNLNDSWYLSAARIKSGEAGYEARRLVAGIVQPRLKVRPIYLWREEIQEDVGTESLHDLMSIDFEAGEHPPPGEILQSWPEIIEYELPLFQTLERALLDALEEASDVGFLESWDRGSADVPSVAEHPQNAYRTGFYPITRTLADLWTRIVARDPDRARAAALKLAESPFLLSQRLWLYMLAHSVFASSEIAAALLKLDDATFWVSGAQVEIMRLLTGRWSSFEKKDRDALEARLRGSIPRCLYPADAFEDEEEWVSIQDSSAFRRLSRIRATGAALSGESITLLQEISKRHPQWVPSSGDRDDFSMWHESAYGPDGHPELLAQVADEALVKEAMRLQRERHFEEGDIWRVFCAADPDRALRGLRHDAQNNQWEIEAWRNLIWAAADKGGLPFQADLADSLLAMPDATLTELLHCTHPAKAAETVVDRG